MDIGDKKKDLTSPTPWPRGMHPWKGFKNIHHLALGLQDIEGNGLGGVRQLGTLLQRIAAKEGGGISPATAPSAIDLIARMR